MSPFRRVLSNALVLLLAAATCSVHVARAQFYDPAVRSIDLVTDVARSPRLLGMGGLSLVVPDRDNHLTLWDFAGSPMGAFAEDTSGTIDLRPSTGSTSGIHDLPLGAGERQDLAGRVNGLQYEFFYRDHKSAAYGLVGRLNTMRRDVPYSDGIEQRRSVGLPEVMPVFNGVFPHFGGGKLRYGLRMRFGGEHLIDQYRTITTNPNGQYLSLDGVTVPSPEFFVPDEYRVNTSGIGGGLSYPIGSRTTFAIGVDAIEQRIKGSNNSDRYSAERRENRPYTVGQAALVGRLGRSLEYGVDGRGWLSGSEESWYFTISAGVGAEPLIGRGKLLEREEKGASLRSRVRMTAGRFELGGSLWTRATDTEITPPDADDATSFNRFLNLVYHRLNADTLSKPDSVVASTIRDRSVGFGAGASMRFARGILGAEYHWSRSVADRTLPATGTDPFAGPRELAWEFRSGLEYECTSIVRGRLGYGYRWWDDDDYVRLNEFKGHQASMGLGLQPRGTSWSFEGGWTLAWHQSDFGDPTARRGTRQLLATQVRWSF